MDARGVPDTPRDPVLSYIVENPEQFAKNLADMLQHANEALAARLEELGISATLETGPAVTPGRTGSMASITRCCSGRCPA